MQLRHIILICCLFLIHFSTSRACGYDWVGDCSSAVHLRINGTLDSFIIADCPSGTRFDGLYLGTLQNLSLANAKAITWESCQNNVSGVRLRYRVYEEGMPGPAFQDLSLDQDYFTLVGPYTTRYRSKASNISLSNGLIAGKDYVFEVYFVADIDTIGDDFIPETTIVKNRGGQNYRLHFRYGGPSANPFVVVPTRVNPPNCHGEANGSIGVSVYGSQNGITYHWSNTNINFYQIFNLPAGTYAVTVSNNQYAEADTIVLGQPEVLNATVAALQPVNCGGGSGSITLSAFGGTAPYQYHWAGGQTGATANFPSSGNYAVTVLDAHNCLLATSASLPGAGVIQANATRHICAGESIVFAGQVFTQPGVYNVLQTAGAGCDTLFTLTLEGSNPAALLSNLPLHADIGCAMPSAEFCGIAIGDAHFEWRKNGTLLGETPCISVDQGGVYSVSVAAGGCIAGRDVAVEAHFSAPEVQVFGSVRTGCDGGFEPMWLYAQTDAQHPQFAWTHHDSLLSAVDSCYFMITEFVILPNGVFIPVLPELTVTDTFGCTGTYDTPQILIVETSSLAISTDVQHVSHPGVAEGRIELTILGGESPYTVVWDNGATGTLLDSLEAGVYCATITDARPCSKTVCVTVSGMSSLQTPEGAALIYPNPVQSGNTLKILTPEKLESFEVMDMQGKTVLHDNMKTDEFMGEISFPASLKAGNYVLKLKTEQGMHFVKISVLE